MTLAALVGAVALGPADRAREGRAIKHLVAANLVVVTFQRPGMLFRAPVRAAREIAAILHFLAASVLAEPLLHGDILPQPPLRWA